ncbi:host attachment protein [Marinobacter sp. NP-4(2019)]|uniref:host attachment protein n=1 Tax=Marinobacter sp. NP-4(2019) TaxID=2488665 RepID=UPI000FC3F3A0|nr:host attachment protein [Marinobacter sp. NP-4(2019)]AZT83329.1 host attachment protein [Marinobacter sp. NP-4(2019)]
MNKWVLVADSSRARVFQMPQPRGDLEELTTMVNPAARLKEHDLVSDSPGAHGDGAMAGRHRMPQKNTARSIANREFAREIAQWLRQAHNENRFDALVIVAAPHFLGELRPELDEQVRQMVTEEMSLDITRASPSEIAATLARHQ